MASVDLSSCPILAQDIRFERDVVATRQRARQIAALLGFDAQDQTRIATAVSEIARNAFGYAGGGRAEFTLEDAGTTFAVRIRDRGPGIDGLDDILDGRYRSETGMGKGIIGAKRLMDDFRVDTSPSRGTTVTLGKRLPAAVAPGRLGDIAARLAAQALEDPIDELRQQNRELMQALEALNQRQRELAELNRELEDTNRGVVALYAELDEKAYTLQRANEVKSRFLSNMTHEFRTPLNSILSLARLLLDRVDGELNPEQEKQIGFIRKAAENLSELVNDLLDLAKVEAGKIPVHPVEFRVSDLFGTIRGMLKPLLAANLSVNLVFESTDHLPPLYTDEGKVAQILRNLISNALKYTERGEVRVGAELASGGMMLFHVTDTGIGIAAADQERIFEEYTQVDSEIQRRVRGTGLGLPLSRRLAQLLGGNISVKSDVGVGSTFYATVAVHYAGPAEVSYVPELTRHLDPTRLPVLVVEDNREVLFLYEKYVKNSGFQIIPARSTREARAVLQEIRPVAIVLDVLLEGESTWGLLTELKENASTRGIPTYVVTIVENAKKALALGADGFHVKPLQREWLIEKLSQAQRARHRTVLIVDDDEISRYLVRGALAPARITLLEAAGGQEGLRLARERHPQAIVLDLGMPDLDGFEVLAALKADSEVRDIPVIVYTAQALSHDDRRRLSAAATVIPKEGLSREETQKRLNAALSKAGLHIDEAASSGEVTA